MHLSRTRKPLKTPLVRGEKGTVHPQPVLWCNLWGFKACSKQFLQVFFSCACTFIRLAGSKRKMITGAITPKFLLHILEQKRTIYNELNQSNFFPSVVQLQSSVEVHLCLNEVFIYVIIDTGCFTWSACVCNCHCTALLHSQHFD